MPYILEVQRFYPDGHILHPEWNGKSEHIGYMNIIFKTKQQACKYYDIYNPHLRSLNAHNTWRSDWDPETYLEYVVREWGSEYLKIPPFKEKQELDLISKFINERILKTSEQVKLIGKRDLYEEFKVWFQQEQGSKKVPKGEELYELMNKKFGECLNKGWVGIKYADKEQEDILENV